MVQDYISNILRHTFVFEVSIFKLVKVCLLRKFPYIYFNNMIRVLLENKKTELSAQACI